MTVSKLAPDLAQRLDAAADGEIIPVVVTGKSGRIYGLHSTAEQIRVLGGASFIRQIDLYQVQHGEGDRGTG